MPISHLALALYVSEGSAIDWSWVVLLFANLSMVVSMKDIKDIEDDRARGVVTLATLVGGDGCLSICAIVYSVLAAIAFQKAHAASTLYYILLTAIALLHLHYDAIPGAKLDASWLLLPWICRLLQT